MSLLHIHRHLSANAIKSYSTLQYFKRKEKLHKWMVLSPSEPQNSNYFMILNKVQQWLIIEWHCKFTGHMRISLCSCIMYDLVWWVFGDSCFYCWKIEGLALFKEYVPGLMKASRGADCITIDVGVKPSWITKQLFSKLKVIAISHCTPCQSTDYQNGKSSGVIIPKVWASLPFLVYHNAIQSVSECHFAHVHFACNALSVTKYSHSHHFLIFCWYSGHFKKVT